MKKQKKTILKSMLTETNTDEWSHKRVIGVFGAFILIILMAACSIFDLKEPPTSLVSAVEMIVIGCIFGTAAEKFANYRRNINFYNNQQQEQQYSDQYTPEYYSQQPYQNNSQNNSKNIEENEN
jgi:uncharacterized membrane protein YeaQ/YmgE (transglycosylase-associated protein family)